MGQTSIHIVRKRAMGDVLWIEPVIRQLAARYNKVVVHTRSNVLFENYPLSNVVFKDKQNLREKMASRLALTFGNILGFINLDRSYEKKQNMHFLHAYQSHAHLPKTIEYPRLYLSEKEQKEMLVNSEKYVVLHLESFSDKNYRKVYGINWDHIVQYLKTKGFEIVTIGKNPQKINGTIYVNTDVRQMMSLISKSRMFIGIDSGPSHIAASLQIPSLIFFGAVNPAYRHFPEIFNGAIVQQECEYAGCFHRQTALKEPDCILVGNDGIPKCSLHSDDYLIQKIEDFIIGKHISNDQKTGKESKA